jgi:hypothetical protein
MAFEPASRERLEEAAGYESFVCREAVKMELLQQGEVSPLTLVIKDTEPHEMQLFIMEDFSAGARVGVLHLFSPLLFVSAFKLLDLYEEWVLEENGRTPNRKFWTFQEKATEMGTGVLTKPDFLAHDASLAEAVDATFKGLVSKRNAITHNSWGKAVAGNLNFDYDDKGTPVEETMSFATVLALADFASLLFNMMVHSTAQTAETIDTLRFLSNKLVSIHGAPTFKVDQPRFFKVVRRTALDEIDLTFIRAQIEKQTKGKSYKYNLKIEFTPTGEEWNFNGDRFIGCDTVPISEIRAGSV